MSRTLSDHEREHGAQVIALFSALVHAWLTSNHQKTAQYQHELDAAGVSVRLVTKETVST
ncbi:MAG: hypothetical protein R3C10_04000 [Pirellulales bacterium]